MMIKDNILLLRRRLLPFDGGENNVILFLAKNVSQENFSQSIMFDYSA